MAVRAAAALAAALAMAAPAVHGAAPSDLLEPDQAFRPAARLAFGSSPQAASAPPVGIDIEFRIADGYYLYRDRLRFEVLPRGAPVGPAEYPEALAIDDPFVGRTSIYRRSVTIRVPFSANVAEPERYRVRITAQGCAEERFCYSPFRQEVAIGSPAPSP